MSRVENRSDRSDRSVRSPLFAAPAIPYAAVLVGLYALESAWAAVLIYHAGIAAIWLAVGPSIWIAWPCVALEPGMAAVLARFGLDGWSLVAFAVYSALANPALEELYWRGVLLDETRRPAPADALFAGYHVLVLALVVEWPFAVAAALVLAAAAWLWRVTAVRWGGLAVPCLSHLAADLAVIGAAWALAAQ